jgi:hypothetical protein
MGAPERRTALNDLSIMIIADSPLSLVLLLTCHVFSRDSREPPTSFLKRHSGYLLAYPHVYIVIRVYEFLVQLHARL